MQISTSTVQTNFLTSFFFFFNDTPTPEISTLPLHDALPICFDAQERPRIAARSGLTWFVLPKRHAAVRSRRGQEPRAATADAGAKPPGEDVVPASQPQVVWRHGLPRVLLDQ